MNNEQSLSPCAVISKIVDFYNKITEHNLSLINKGVRPTGVLTIKTDNPEDLDHVQEKMKIWNQGPRNAGDVFVLSSECQWHEMGMKPLDTNFIDGQKEAAKQIAQAFGVHPILIGLQSDSTFANYKEARMQFWEDNIVPLMNKICRALNHWLFGKYDMFLKPDVANIEALNPKHKATWDQIDKASFLTQNEKRAFFGYQPNVADTTD